MTLAIHVVFIIDFDLFLAINNPLLITFVVVIVFCNVTVYRETRRHEQQIADQQVSVEARENFLGQKRALKLTATIVALGILNYLPAVSFRRVKDPLKQIVTIDTLCAIYMTVSTLAVLNSFVNPFIYCFKLRPFRVAFIELLLGKNHVQAEEFERKIFGGNAVANAESSQEGVRETQAVCQVNVREEEDVCQVNAVANNEPNQQGEREEQDH